jgi:hypothetical protein
MHVPTEDELAAIAVAYFTLQREQTSPAPTPSRWRLAARALTPDEPARIGWRKASRLR